MEANTGQSDVAGSAEEAAEPGKTQEEKLLVQSGRGVKRKNISPPPSLPPPSSSSTTSPATTVFATPSKDKDESKPSSAKKRRKSTSSGLAPSKTGSPSSSSSSSFNPAAMTERQQMAYLLQMTDPQKKSEEPSTPAVGSGKEVTTPSRVHKRNERGETPLHVACIRGDLRLAASLIKQGAEVNATDHAGWTPLHEACNHGHPDLVSLLLREGAGINSRGMDGDTPLHDATINSHPKVVKLLMEHGGDPNLANEKEQTPLDVCPNEDIRLLLTATLPSTPTQPTHLHPTTPTPLPTSVTQESHLETERRPSDETHTQDDSAFSPDRQQPLQSIHHKVTRQSTTPSSSTTSEGAVSQRFLPVVTPSRTTTPTPLPTSVAQESCLEQIDPERRPSDETHTQEDSAFSPDQQQPLQSIHHKVTRKSCSLTTSEGAVSQRLLPVTVTPSRTRKRSKRGREMGKTFSDVSSSESDSELLVTLRKVPRLVDRLPASVREEGGGGGGGEGEKEEEKDGGVEKEESELEEGAVNLEKEGEKVEQEKGGATIGEEEEEKEQSTDNVELEGKDEEGQVSGDDNKPHVELEEGGRGAIEEKTGTDVVAADSTAVVASPEAGGEGEEETAETEKEIGTCTGKEVSEQQSEEPVSDGTVEEPPSSKTEPLVTQLSSDTEESPEHGESEQHLAEGSETSQEIDTGSKNGHLAEKSQEIDTGSAERPTETGESDGEGEGEKTTTTTELSNVEKSEEGTTSASGLANEVESAAAVSGEDGQTVAVGVGEEERVKEGEGVEEVGGQEVEEGGRGGEEGEMGGKGSEAEEKESKESSTTEGEKEVEPLKLLLSIPFQHIKFKRGRGLSPLRIVRTPSRDKVPTHETSVLVQHGKVESVSSQVLRGVCGGIAARGESMERMDTGSPVEQPRGSRGSVSDKPPKHGGRKTLQAARKAREMGRGGDEAEVGEGEGVWTSGAEPGWETTPPGGGGAGRMSQGPSRGARLSSTGSGWEGGVVPSHVMEDLPSRASPTLSRGSTSRLSDDGEGDSDGLSDDSDSSGGTVVSLSTSLPIKFAGLQQSHRPSPLATAVSTTTGSGSLAPDGATSGASGGDGLDVVSVASQSTTETKSSPSAQGSEKVAGDSKRPATTTAPIRDHASDTMDEPTPLPPKLRIRPVLRSSVVQQRKECAGRPPSLSHLPPFLLLPRPPPRQPHSPTSPKVVYPPIHMAMYRLFSEQEAERIQLHSAHLTQQDCLLQCMEQELVRAHQRASRHSACAVSVCAVLLERMLPRADALTDERAAGTEPPSDPHEGEGVDERLLGSLVQDVWDKFCHQRALLLSRQRHEAEALWQLQHLQWTDRLKELGFNHQVNFPTIHVPKLFC